MDTTVVKGLKVLEALAFSDGACALTDMARTCGLSKSNAHRLLRTLEECGYVRRDPRTRTYESTLRLWELGTRVFNRLDLRVIAVPHLRELARSTKESVHLSVFDNDEVLYVDKVDSVHAVRAYVGVGDRGPLHCTATGKAMLAGMPDDVVERVCAQLKRYTSNTAAAPRKLKADLELIREQGYAITSGEWRAGVLGIAAAIRSPSGIIVGGIGIAGPEERMRQANTEKQIAAVLHAAERISKDLGFSQASSDAETERPVPTRAASKPKRIAPRRQVA
ncbi:MAG: IclR family transcriptional regulator [Parvibaculaceae bacterium]